MSTENKKLPETSDKWNLIITNSNAMLQVGNTVQAMTTAQFANKLIKDNAKQEWMPIAVRYLSADKTKFLFEQKPTKYSQDGVDIMLPWRYYMFVDNVVYVMFRSMTLLGENNTFHGFFLKQVSSVASLNYSFTEMTISERIRIFEDKFNLEFDLDQIDNWIIQSLEADETYVGREQIIELLKDKSGGVDRSQVMQNLFAYHTFNLEMPKLEQPIQNILAPDSDTVTFKDIAKKYDEADNGNQEDLYKLFYQVFNPSK